MSIPTMEDKKLKDWLTYDMKASCHVSDKTDLSNLFRGNKAKLWDYLVENIKSRPTAILVHQNLALQSRIRTKDTEDGASSSYSKKKVEYRKLVQELIQQKRSVSQLEVSIESRQKELQSEAHNACCLKKSISDSRVKRHMLEGQHESVLHWINALQRQRLCISSFVDKHAQDTVGKGNRSYGEKLQKIQADVKLFLNELLRGSLSKSQLQAKNSAIKKQLADLISQASSIEILDYLIHNIKKTTDELYKDKEAIDHVKEAEQLRFELQSGTLVDDSVEPPLTMSVMQLIEERQSEHQGRFLETESLKSKVEVLSQNFERFMSKIMQKLNALHDQQPLKAKLIRELSQAHIDVQKTQTGLEFLKQTNLALENEVSRSSEHVSTLQQKYKMINSFKTEVQSKQNHICVLMKQNSMAKVKVSDRQNLMITTVNKIVASEHPMSTLSASTLPTALTTEVRQFQAVPLHTLGSDPCSMLRTLELVEGKSKPEIEKICLNLKWDSSKSYDVWLDSIRAERREMLFNQMKALTSIDTIYMSSLVDDITELLPLAKSTTDSLVSELQSKHKQSLALVQQSFTKCDQVDEAIENWWQQPGVKLDLTGKT